MRKRWGSEPHPLPSRLRLRCGAHLRQPRHMRGECPVGLSYL